MSVTSTQIGSATGQAAAPAPGSTASTFQFIAGWLLLIVILTFINKSRVGHVIIYYSLLLIILLILVTEYTQLAPLLQGIQTIGELDQQPTTGGTF
jgi:hypothetical protein